MVAFVNRNHNESTSVATSLAVTLAGVTAGNLLIVTAVVYDGGQAPRTLTVADGQGSYTSIVRSTTGSAVADEAIESFYLVNGNSGSHTATVSVSGGSGSTNVSCEILEYSGSVTSGSPIHDTQVNTGTNSVTDTINTPTVTASTGELVYMGESDLDGAQSMTPGTGYTQRANTSGVSFLGFLSEDKQVNANDQPSLTTGESSGAKWCTLAFSIKAAVAGRLPGATVTLQAVKRSASY